MPRFRVLKLSRGESPDALRTSKTAPRAAGGVYEPTTKLGGLTTVSARSAVTPRGRTREEREAMSKTKKINVYNPDTQELEPLEIEDPHTGFMDWTPQQWAMALAAVAGFITTIVTLFAGNPLGIPGAG